MARAKSAIWGSGAIDNTVNPSLDPDKVFAVRGKKTRELIDGSAHSRHAVYPLGDPALLLPNYVTGKGVAKRHWVGIVPHLMDQAHQALADCAVDDGIKIIDLRGSVQTVLSDLLSCRLVVSSSLHGLIVADAYGIPNVWVSLSNRLVGGDFKFRDYLSTTTNPNKLQFRIRGQRDMEVLLKQIDSHARVNSFRYECADLEQSLADALVYVRNGRRTRSAAGSIYVDRGN